MKATLYLIPTTLGESEAKNLIPKYVIDILNNIEFLIVENIRTTRRYLVSLGLKERIDKIEFFVLNKHTKAEELSDFLQPIFNGKDVGIISEAGCPGIADPGASVVEIAHKKGIKVVPMIGPSSILLALIASGMNGQSFSFSGYLPVKKPERIKKLKMLENRSFQEKQSQIFMETPFRNMEMLNDILKTCNPNTMLSIAADISLKSEFIQTKKISDWKLKLPDLHKRPTIFILQKI